MKCPHCNHPIENHLLQGGCGLCNCPHGRTSVENLALKTRVAELEALRGDVYRMMQSVRDEIPEQAYTAIIVIVPEWANVWDRVQS